MANTSSYYQVGDRLNQAQRYAYAGRNNSDDNIFNRTGYAQTASGIKGGYKGDLVQLVDRHGNKLSGKALQEAKKKSGMFDFNQSSKRYKLKKGYSLREFASFLTGKEPVLLKKPGNILNDIEQEVKGIRKLFPNYNPASQEVSITPLTIKGEPLVRANKEQYLLDVIAYIYRKSKGLPFEWASTEDKKSNVEFL